MYLYEEASDCLFPTAPADFNGASVNRSLQSTGDEFCLQVFIVNDTVVELCEEFGVSLTATINPRFPVARSAVVVTIYDDEGVEILCTVGL